MHEPKRVTDLVSDDILESFGDDAVGHGSGAGSRVYLRRLHESPVVDGVDDIVVDQNRGVDDFACPRVGPRGSHGILYVGGKIADARITEVVGVEVRVALGKVHRLQHILEANPLESLVPPQDAGLDGTLPQRGKGVLDVIHNGLDRLGKPTCEIGGRVFRFYPPPLHKGAFLDGSLCFHFFVNEKHADARVAQSGRHLLLGQKGEGEVDTDGDRIIAHRRTVLARKTDEVVPIHLHAGILLKSLKGSDAREVFFEGGSDAIGAHRLGDDGEETVFLKKERGGVEQHCLVCAAGLNGEGEEVEMVVVAPRS